MCQQSLPFSRRRRPDYDRRAVLDACTSCDPEVLAKVDELEDFLDNLEPIPVRVDHTPHSHMMKSAIRDKVAEFSPDLSECRSKIICRQDRWHTSSSVQKSSKRAVE